MKIELIKHKNIDFKKYDACLDMANASIYPYSWYLDVVTKKDWNVLVLGDYEAVMPLPYGRSRKTMFRKRIIQPLFCQQLGVFSKTELGEEEFNLFYEKFKSKNPFSYSFNTKNIKHLKLEAKTNLRVNCILDLGFNYDEVFKQFHHSKKRKLKKLESKSWKLKESDDVTRFLNFIENKSDYNIQGKSLVILERLLIRIINENLGSILSISNEKEILATVFIVRFKNRLYYLVAGSSKQGKKETAMLYLLSELFKKIENKKYVFDFEGSSIPGVQRFYLELGAKIEEFVFFKNNTRTKINTFKF